MSNFSVLISTFLTERPRRYAPNDPAIARLKRLEKIDFTGTIHLSEKPTKTDMIIVQPGDLVISGINVAKGAIAVHEGGNPIIATIHYSSYSFDQEKIDISFFKRFLKSPVFVQALVNQVKGGIKTEIKAKHLLRTIVHLPSLADQKITNAHFESFEDELNSLDLELGQQSSHLTQLRQAILQEAIEGKLTAGWRKDHPVVTGDSDTDAAALLEKIKAEKERMVAEGTIKKQKPLAPIKPGEVPFGLPEGWVWTRLGEVAAGFQYGSSAKSLKSGKVPVLRMGNIQNGGIDRTDLVYTNNTTEIAKYSLNDGDLLFNRTNSRELVGKTGLFQREELTIFAGYLVRFTMAKGSSPEYANFVMNSKFHREWCQANKIDALGQSNINATKLRDFIFPFPPLAEQRAIVERVEALLSMVDELEQQVADRKLQAQDLMQTVLAEAFQEIGP